MPALRSVILIWFLVFVPEIAFGGGPRFIAGTTYFNPGVAGQPVHWAGGVINYYIDQGPLSAQIGNAQATAMVDVQV